MIARKTGASCQDTPLTFLNTSKTVNGITADYDVDQTYWAFYVDGEYAMTGVDATDIVEGSQYMFKVEK